MGKTNKFETADSNVVLSLHVVKAQVSYVWKLDTLGILDPGQRATKEELVKAAKEHFNRNTRIIEDGRYEVSLPWVNGHPSLSSCKIVEERRLKNSVESLKKSGKLEDYEGVFNE